MAQKDDLGRMGEEVAARFLVNAGYRILERNWHYKHKELDLIVQKDNEMVVVEVKTRTSDYFENPKDAVTLKKQKFIFDATEAYLLENEFDIETRFDIIEILISDERNEINHIENAFRPGW